MCDFTDARKMLGPLIVVLCIIVGVAATIKTGGDNPVEEIASDVISQKLGVEIDISDIMEGKPGQCEKN